MAAWKAAQVLITMAAWKAAQVLLTDAYQVKFNRSAPTVNCNGSPKSGTTLLEYIAYQLYERAGRTVAHCDLLNKHSLPAGLPPFHHFSGHIDPAFKVLARCKLRGIRNLWSKACVSERFLNKTELAHLRFLLIVRDPRETTRSWIEWTGSGPSPDLFVKWTTENAAIISLRYVWAQAIGLTNPAMVVVYEDLVEDKVAQIFRIAQFLDAEVSLADVMDIVNATEPKHMSEDFVEVGRGKNMAGIVNPGHGVHTFRTKYDNRTVCQATKGLVARAHPALMVRWLRDHPDDQRFLLDPDSVDCGA